jgi:endo-1,4-beta-xylanase
VKLSSVGKSMSVLTLCVAGCVGTQAGPPSAPLSSAAGSGAAALSLREAAAPTGAKVGVALATYFMSDARYEQVAAREFDSVTPENEMKWGATEPSPGSFRFEAGDRLVGLAERHAMRVRGHTLVWHNQLAPWVSGLSDGELRAAMLRHVRELTLHWKGRIAQWDVVNEAVDDSGKLRQDSPFTRLGPGYLAEAFRAAHEADPGALLFYNDYDIEAFDSPKTQGAYELVKGLKESGAPIHGIGFQMHVDPRAWPSSQEMQRNFERFAKLGLSVELTEIDVPLGEIPGSAEQKLAKQSELARGVAEACLAVPACSGMTFWGLTDKHSWLSTPEWGPRKGRGPHLPLLFDENYRPKPMHSGLVEALRGTARARRL